MKIRQVTAMAMNKTVSWTDDQQMAIDHRNGGAIVDANAGAGKTAVLTTRIVDILSDKENITDPSGLVIITFTKKAAAELKTRLTRKMKEKLSEEPQNAEFLRRQCTLLHNARISTISSFCFSLIRENIELSSLSQGFSIMEEARAQMLRYAITEQAVENYYKTADKDSLKLILDHFAGKNGDKMLVEAIMSITGYAQNLPDPDSWYELCKDSSRLDSISDSSKNNVAPALTELSALCDNLTVLYDGLCGQDKLKAAEKRAKECMEQFIPFCRDKMTEIRTACDSDDFSNITFMDMKAIKAAVPDFTKTKIDVHSTDVKQTAEALEKLFSAAKAYRSIKSRLYTSQPVIDILVDIARTSEALYHAEKETLNAADYADAERQLYNMIQKHPEIKERAGIKLIIVDEFQDSNRLQYEIFRALSDNEENLYFVGDIKQSIYAFRGAQSEVFDTVTKNPVYTHLSLNHNFRSTDKVINGINDIFSSVMTYELGGVDYARNSRLVLGNPENVSENPEDIVEVITVTDENKNSDNGNAEADYVAYHINKMIKSGYMVENRPCKAEDFAILLRSVSDKAPCFASALADYGIPCVTKNDGKLFSEPETILMTDFLKVIDDPYSDESLARLLMSPLFGFSADDMAAVRTCTAGFDVKGIREYSEIADKELKAYASASRKKPLYTCLKRAVAGYELSKEQFPALSSLYKERPELFGTMTDRKCSLFEAELDRLRGIMAASSPSELIKCIYDTTSTADLLTVGENAENRRINLMELLSLAEEYGRYHTDGILSEFLSYIEEMKERGQKIGTNADSTISGVQIMSIHASKGLEFPIVFVSDCAKTFNTDDATKPVIFSEEYGICIKDVNKAMMSKFPSPAYEKTAEAIISKMRSEEMRLLYVAATRARNKLIFSGRSSTGLSNANSAEWLIARSSYLSWVLVPLAKGYTENIRYREVSLYQEKEKDRNDSDIDIVAVESPVTEADESAVLAIKQQITNKYPHLDATRLAAKYTATGLAAMKRQDKEKKCELYVAKPAFATGKGKGKLSGKKRGDAYHKLMEHIPFDKPMSEQEVKNYIENCTTDFLSDAERECIEPSDISRFFDDDITARMLKSGRIYREYPIFHRLSDEIMEEISEDFDKHITDRPYVQGIADMFFIEDDGIVLIDYKTDSHSDEEKLSEDYSFQLKVYEEALSKAFSLPVKEKYIYSFKNGRMITL